MRTSGFPCRSIGCDQIFRVTDQTSMEALHAASAARTAHEVTDHSYKHLRLTGDTPSGSWSSRSKGTQK